MDCDKLISVIVPVYNVEDYLGKCIESIIDQTYKRLEILLIDDGSTDRSGEICDEYAKRDDRIRVIHKKNGGVSSARNAGLDSCTGDYISFIDSDDWIEADMLGCLMSAIEKYKTDFSVCELSYVRNDGTKRKSKIWADMYDKPLYGKAVYDEILCRSAVLWNKLFDKSRLAGVLFDEKYIYGEDTMYFIKALEYLSSAVITERNGYNYRAERDGNVVSAPINEKSLNFLGFACDAYDILRQRGMIKAGIIRMSIVLQEVLGKIPHDNIAAHKKYLDECKKTAKRVSLNELLSPDVLRGGGKKHIIRFFVIRISPLLYLKTEKA